MPHFGSPSAELATGKKLTDADLVTAVRFLVAAESAATQQYAQLAESTDNKLALEVLGEMAGEQLVRVETFLRLLRELAPSDERLSAREATEEVAATLRRVRRTTGTTRIVAPTM